MLATPKDKKRLYLATSLCDGLEDNNIQQIIMLLMTKDADPNILIPNYGITPFHLVVGNDSETFAECVTKLFLQHSGNPNVKSVDGLTPVHVAAAWGRSKVLELLLVNGGDPLCIDNDGRSPFHYAFDGKYYQAIATLSKYCNNSTNDDDKPKYNMKLEKILLSTGNLLAEYEPLKDPTYNTNFVTNMNTDYETGSLTDMNYSINVDKHVEKTKRIVKHKTFLGQNCGLLNPPSPIKTYPCLTAMEDKQVRNLPIHSKFDSSPRTCLNMENQEQENYHINKAINSLCIPFTTNCIISNKENESSYCNESRYANCFHTLVSANIHTDKKEKSKSVKIEKDGINECVNTNFVDTRCYHNKFTYNQSNITLSDNKTPSKSYFDFGRSTSSRKKKKIVHACKERLLNIKTSASKKLFVKCDHKRQMTPKTNKRDSPSQYPNIKMSAQSTPRKTSKNFHVTCKCSKHSKCAHKEKKNDLKNYALNDNGEDNIKSMPTDTYNLNKSFHSDVESDFHTSPHVELFPKLPNKRVYNSNFAVNLNNGKYDEDEVCENSVLCGSDHYSIDYSACPTEEKQAKHCMCECDIPYFNTFKLCDMCKDTTDNTQMNKISQHHKSGLPCMSLQDRDLLVYTNKNFTENELLHECAKEDKKRHVAENDEKLSLYNLCLEGTLAKESIQGTVQTLDVKYNPCSINKTYIPTKSVLSSSATNKTHVSIQQEYVYEDLEEGVVLLERRFCTSTSILDSTKNDEYHSTMSEDLSEAQGIMPPVIHLPKELLTMDNETLRQKLVKMGDTPGPITATTKHVYFKRLINLESKCNIYLPEKRLVNTQVDNDSIILQPWLQFGKWLNDLPIYAQIEKNTFAEFVNPDQSRRWREGTAKTCFNYLLLDSRITQNLPNRNNLTEHDIWATFVSAIFYVGKGKRSRPYSHLYDAFNAWVLKDHNKSSRKIKRILDMWNDGHGVVCLHIFQNIIPVEAYTREAAMIEALGLNNLDNCKGGDYYGIIATWSAKKKQKFGRYLLYRAMQIFMYEGERQLFPEHL